MTNSLRQQLRLYLSEGVSSYPKRNPHAVLEVFGPDALRRVERLSEEIGGLEPDWTVHDLVSATHWAVHEMRRRHPDLDDQGASVLGWAFSFWNK
ncbi:hypothetical protein [Phenylobacterium sp.]|uniref:hypothetical protein n=1 Tax=Phenylobacterium sp. TaxID=1871053 RepID=UPI002BFE2784|nr:hypothetical protein [Phenylobacterium sp.]HVI34411.1 hypothetical protein [Phenylobacterium sp.]